MKKKLESDLNMLLEPISTAAKARFTCQYCGRRRNIDKLVLVFIHPQLAPGGLYACILSKHGRPCNKAYINELLLTHNTGQLHLVRASKESEE